MVHRPICDFVGLMQQSRDTYIYRRVVRKAHSVMSRSLFSFPIFMEEKSIHSEIVKFVLGLSMQERLWLEENYTEKMESRDAYGK